MPMSSSIPPFPDAASSPVSPPHCEIGDCQGKVYRRNLCKQHYWPVKDEPYVNPHSIIPDLPTSDPCDIAWMAGLFDGEGSISIARVEPRQSHHSPYYELIIALGMVQEEPARIFKSLFEGTVHIRRSKKTPNRREQHCWSVRQWRAARALEEMRPYLRVKDAQADLVLEFIELKRYKTQGSSFTEEDLREQAAYHAAMAALNHSCWARLRDGAEERDKVHLPARRNPPVRKKPLVNGAILYPERLARGTDNPASVLSEEVIPQIQALYTQGHTARALGRQFGVSATTITRIVNRETWKHVAPAVKSSEHTDPKRRALGADNGKSRLQPDDVREIRRLSAEGYTQRELADMFDTPKTNIHYIVTGKTWKHLLSED